MNSLTVGFEFWVIDCGDRMGERDKEKKRNAMSFLLLQAGWMNGTVRKQTNKHITGRHSPFS